MKHRAIINPAIRPAIANLDHKLREEATDLADDVRLEESSLLASCEGFLIDALYSSERVKEIRTEFYADESRRDMKVPFEAAYHSCVEDVSELLDLAPMMQRRDLLDCLAFIQEDSRISWADMIENYPGTDDYDSAVWNEGSELGYTTAILLLRDHLSV